MPAHVFLDSKTFDEKQLKLLVDAFEEAIFLADISDRNSREAESVALRIIRQYVAGERDPRRICRQAIAN